VTDPIHDAARALLDTLARDRVCQVCDAWVANEQHDDGCEWAALREALGTQTTNEVLWEGPAEHVDIVDEGRIFDVADDVNYWDHVRVIRATDQPSEEWVTRYLVMDGGDAYQQWIVVPDNGGYRSTPIECRIRATDVGEVDDELLWSAAADQPTEVAGDE
jgi:hypothetical protein